MKAFQIKTKGFQDFILYYVAETSSKARHMAFKAAAEAGYRVTYGDFQVIRYSPFDEFAKEGEPRCIGSYDVLDKRFTKELAGLNQGVA